MHRFKISVFVGLSIGGVFSVLDTIRDIVFDLLDDWNTSPMLVVSLLAQLAFIAGFLLASHFFVRQNLM